jgi:hypothetical protein
MKILTIGIPSFNRPEAAVDSLTNLLQLEVLNRSSILLVNNGSTKEYKITELKKIYQEKFRYMEFDSNLGFGLNLIRLIEQCETKYLLFLSDEDNLIPLGFEKLLDFLNNKNPSLVILREENRLFGKIYKLKQRNVKGASSYISGIIVNTETLKKHMDLLKLLVETEEFASLYPQVVISALLNSIRPGYIASKPITVKRVELPPAATSKNRNPYWYPTERVQQHLSFQRCILELSNHVNSEVVKELLKLSKTLNSNFFGLIYDSIRSMSPDLQPIFVRSSLKTIINFYYKTFKKKLQKNLL